MDGLLRAFLPLGALSAARPHQHLPAAVDRQEVPGRDQRRRTPHGTRLPTTTPPLHSLDLDAPGRDEDQDATSRVIGDDQARFRGSPRVRPPRATRLSRGYTAPGFTCVQRTQLTTLKRVHRTQSYTVPGFGRGPWQKRSSIRKTCASSTERSKH